MRKLVLALILVTATFTSRPAEACRSGHPCPVIIDVFAWTFAAAVVGGYSYGTGYFVYHDVTDDTQTVEYGAYELAYNGLFGTVFTGAAIASARDGDAKTALVTGAIGLAHDTMAVHGAWRVTQEWKDPGHPPEDTARWIAGIAYGANTLVWTAGLADDHGRTYGIVEAAVNAPIAAGVGYLAIDRMRDGERGATVLYGSMAVLSGAFAYHGLKTALSPPEPPGLDLLGTDVMPVAVSDGREIGPGLGMSGTW